MIMKQFEPILLNIHKRGFLLVIAALNLIFHFGYKQEVFAQQNIPPFSLQPQSFSPVTTQPTGLQGYYDFQISGGSAHYIAVNQSNTDQVFVVYMLALEQGNVEGSRRIGYTYSLDGGQSWSSKVVPLGGLNVSQGFPDIDYLPDGSGGGGPLIAGHMDPGTGFQSLLFRQQTPFSGFFEPIYTDTAQFAKDLVWPKILAGHDGARALLMATSPVDYSSYYAAFDPQTNTFGSFIGPLKNTNQEVLRSYGLYGMAQSQNLKKVAMYYLSLEDFAYSTLYYKLYYSESSDSGKTFPDFTAITPYPTIVNGDTLGAYLGCDGVYAKDDLHLVISSSKTVFIDGFGWGYDPAGTGIWHWTSSGGFTQVAGVVEMQTMFGARWNAEIMPNGGAQQTNMFPMGYPSIGTDDTGVLHCVFQVARPNKSKMDFNYISLCYTKSEDEGKTWSKPFLLDTDSLSDFRYPSVAKYNPEKQVYVVYQQDSETGSGIRDGAPVTQTQLMFTKLAHTSGIDEPIAVKPKSFSLAQNYPNPFNPSTTISYTLTRQSMVNLQVYDVLGRKVRNLVNKNQPKGTYQILFQAKGLASGVYWLRLSAAGQGLQTRNMILLK